MNKRQFKIVVVVMTVAIMTLAQMQGVWLTRLYRQSVERYADQIRTAVTAALYRSRLDSRSKRLLRVPLLKSWTRETRKPRPSFDSITLAYRAFKNRSETRCLICRA